MNAVYRYLLEIADTQSVSMPVGARVLPAPPNPRSSDRIEIWAQVDIAQPMELRTFHVVGTGRPMPENCGDFVGTVMTHGGDLVWHVFEAAR